MQRPGRVAWSAGIALTLFFWGYHRIEGIAWILYGDRADQPPTAVWRGGLAIASALLACAVYALLRLIPAKPADGIPDQTTRR